jgi:hypothetical protein
MKNIVKIPAPVQAVATIVKADAKSVGFGKTGSCYKQN